MLQNNLKVTFIDKVLANADNGEIFVQLPTGIYSYREVRYRLPTYPEWIQNIITLIYYDTELALAGLQRKSYEPIIPALSAVGLQAEAEILNSVTEHISNESLSSSHSKLALNNDYEVFLNKIFLYADNHLQKLNHL